MPASPMPRISRWQRFLLTVDELTEHQIIGIGIGIGIGNDSALVRVHGGARHAR